ncbi:histidinol-phosphate transaminase [Salibacterium salarium]|uniref:Histidinol-phosphate aminotransferase n=1 Tax=Salibacterium salarium TaxID=284579 RepID=A0A3R9P969_9BACI|nr:histidinol-phosphate transaminase [Salibacterium salarium]RSL33144.1 histidinol-phosphate transaminase [Salibacterium salarium]
MIEPRAQMNNVSMYSPGKPVEELKRELGLDHVIKMASNENPYGFSPMAKEAMMEEMKNVHYYPEITAPVLADKLSRNLEVPANTLIFGNGSDEIIRMITRTYLNVGEEAVMASVTFPRYKTNVVIEGGKPVNIPMKEGTHDLQAMKKAITSKTKIVFVCNPNNPTGTIVGEEELLQFLESIPSDVLVILDEAYYEYVHTDDYLQSINYLDQFPNLIILRTFSKIYGLASVRVGYGIMASDIVQEILKGKDPFNVNRLAQAAAWAAIGDKEFMTMTKQKNEEGRLYLESNFSRLGLSYFPSHTNFVMVDVAQNAEEVYNRLLEKGIIVRPGHLMGYSTMIRVTIGKQEENEQFIQALEQVLEK